MSGKSSLTALKKKGSNKLKNLRAPDGTQYYWHPASKIGKGSFGEVYKGWEERPGFHGTPPDVAIKMIKKEYIDQDPKVQENLDREINIMKMLSNCTYSVRLFNVIDTKDEIVLAMELCDCDLDQFVKDRPFGENHVRTFLYQMSEGIKMLQKHQVVHRDLKPSNILIKSTSHDNFIIKLADFGFARQFTTNMDMTSLAGTPVFMAPEALRCIFYKGKKYDEKVDLWSIGALLYKVIIGQCGFYANLQDILTILEKKGDAIAHVRSSGVHCPKYITEFSDEVEKRLSPYFKKKIEELLVKLLKLEPSERMTFQEFFDFVDDLIKSKLTVINLQDGVICKIEFDKQLTLKQLSVEIEQSLGVPSNYQLLVHQVDDNQSPINLSSLQQHQFQQHIISIRPDHEKPVYLLNLSTAADGGKTRNDIKLIEEARDDPLRGLKMIKEERLTEVILQSLHAHPTSLESSFHRQIQAVDQLWKFITSQRESISLQKLDYSIGGAETTCYLTIESLQNFTDCFTAFVDHDVIERCQQERQLLEKLLEQISSKHDNLQELTAVCNMTNVIHLSPTLISKTLTKLLTSVKKLPKCPMSNIQDQLDEIYGQLVELNNVIDQNVTNAIVELQRAYYSIMEIQRLQDDLQQFCYSTENRALKIREYKNELYEMLQNKLKEGTVTAVPTDKGNDVSSTAYLKNDEDIESNPESTLTAEDLNLKSYDYISMTPGRHGNQQDLENSTHVMSTSHVLIDSDKMVVGDLVLLLPTPHEGQLFVAHTKSYFIFLDKSCLADFGLSPHKPANNPIAGEIISLPEIHHINRDSSSELEIEFKINPNVKFYHTIRCKNPVDVTIKGRPSPKLPRKKKN